MYPSTPHLTSSSASEPPSPHLHPVDTQSRDRASLHPPSTERSQPPRQTNPASLVSVEVPYESSTSSATPHRPLPTPSPAHHPHTSASTPPATAAEPHSPQGACCPDRPGSDPTTPSLGTDPAHPAQCISAASAPANSPVPPPGSSQQTAAALAETAHSYT